MKIISADQFKSQFGEQAYNSFSPLQSKPSVTPTQSTTQVGQPSFPASVGGGIADIPTNVAKTVGNIPSSAIGLAKQAVAPVNPFDTQSPINIGSNITKSGSTLVDVYKDRGAVQGTKDILGGFADTYLKLGETIYGGLDKAYNALLDNPKKAISDVTEHIAKIGIEDPLFIPTLLYGGGKGAGAKSDAISTLASPVTRGVDTSLSNITKTITQKAENIIDKGLTNTQEVVSKVASKVIPNSASIMNRVARLKPTDFNNFTKMAGETPGDYLTRTGNFGTPDKIIATEAEKFATNLKNVDNEIGKLPGLYQEPVVKDALDGLLQKAANESTVSVKSPYLDEVTTLSNKYATEGLNMKEINRVKRLYERNVKLGFNKLMNGEKVTQATNVDNALREWQFTKAKELGLKNLDELNKQTQLSKFIVDKLGGQVVGQSGLNGMNLTDWIMLSGGNPAAVGGFLTKKFFSSKGVQSKIAEMLNKGEIKGMTLPKTSMTAENIKRQVSPHGLLGLPEGTGSRTIENRVPIRTMGKSTIEAQATEALTSRPNAKGGMNVTDLKNKVTRRIKTSKRK